MNLLHVGKQSVVPSKGLSTMFTRIIHQSQVHHVVVVIPVSFLSKGFSTITANIVPDTHMGFQMPTQCTWVAKLSTTKLTRLLLKLKLVFFLLSKGAIVDFVSQDVSLKSLTSDKPLTA